MDPTAETCGYMSSLTGFSPPFLTFFKEHYCAHGDKEVFLDLWKGHLISLVFNSFYFLNYENITHLQET